MDQGFLTIYLQGTIFHPTYSTQFTEVNISDELRFWEMLGEVKRSSVDTPFYRHNKMCLTLIRGNRYIFKQYRKA